MTVGIAQAGTASYVRDDDDDDDDDIYIRQRYRTIPSASASECWQLSILLRESLKRRAGWD